MAKTPQQETRGFQPAGADPAPQVETQASCLIDVKYKMVLVLISIHSLFFKENYPNILAENHDL